MSAYSIVLAAHSGLRWLVILLAAVVVFKSLAGMFSQLRYSKLDNILAASYVGTIHLQVLIGLILYFFLSPVTTSAIFPDFGGAMKNPELRFWAVEHLSMMILAAVAAQTGRSKAKKAVRDVVKYRIQVVAFGIAILLILFAIPWDRL